MDWQRVLGRFAGKRSSVRKMKRRMLVEQLSSRQLLAVDFGAIGGVAFTDNANDGLTADDVRLAGVQVQLFVDTNGNNTFDAGGTDALVNTVTTGTGANAGVYRFDDLSINTYFVVQDSVAGQINPSPLTVEVINDSGVQVDVIDDYFAKTDPLIADTANPIATEITPAPGAIGGERDMRLTYVSGNNDLQLEVDPLSDTLTVSAGFGTTGRALLQYDGIDGSLDLDTAGLGGANISDGDARAGFEVEIIGDNPGGSLEIIVFSDALNSSVTVIPIPEDNLDVVTFVPFSAFTTTSGTGAVFTSVGAIEARIQLVEALDVSFSIIESIKPDLVPANLANLQPMSLGGTVFDDNNPPPQFNNGVLDVGETGFAGAEVQLFRRDANDGSLDPTTDAVFLTTTTLTDGSYSFPNLLPNDYLVVISDSQFVTGAPLFGYFNSTGNDPAPDTNADADSVDDGRLLAGIGIASSAVTLVSNSEPINDADTDPNTNTTVDFGFVPQINLSITKVVNDGLSTLSQGGAAVFDIQIGNAGPLAATGVSVSDVIPAGLTFDAATSDFGAFNETVTGNSVTVDIGSLAVGSTATFQLGTTVDANQFADLTNTTTVVGNEFETDASDNTASAVVDLTSADLSITKTDNNDPVSAGNQLTYAITVTNNGPDTATDVMVTDTLISDVSFAGSTGAGAVVESPVGSGDLLISLGSLTSGQSVTTNIIVNVAPNATSPLSNTASVVANPNNDPNMGNNTATQPTNVERNVDVAIDKTVTGTPLAGGTTPLTYTIEVTNNGPSDARNVQVADLLDDRLAFVGLVTANGVTVNQVGQDLTFDVGALDASETIQFSFEASILSSATGVIPNTGTVSTTDNDTVPTNNQDTVNVTIQTQVDLILSKDVDPSTAIPGQDQLVYSFTVSHDTDSPSDASGVVVTDNLPDGVTFISSSGSGTVVENPVGSGNLEITLGSLPVGQTSDFTITVSTDASATGTLTNPASVTATQTEIDPTNNSDTAVTTLTPQFDVTIDKSVINATPTPGQNVSYTVILQNTGPSTATGVVLSDDVPAGLTFVSGTMNGQSATGTGPISFPAITLTPNQSATATLVFTVGVDTSGQVVNTATVVADAGETNLNNNSDTATITGAPVVDLSVIKNVNRPVAQAGSDLQYTVTVSNTGPSTAANVQAVDTLPSGVTFVRGTGRNGQVLSSNNGTVTVDGGSLAANASFTFTVNATINSGVTATQTNQVVVSTSTSEPNTSNNTATAQTTVDPLNSSIAGTVYVDANNSGALDTGEVGIANVTLTLTGSDSQGNAVNQSTTTDANGDYKFSSLAQGTYAIAETQPAGFRDGRESAGTGATATTLDDMFTQIGLGANATAIDFDFGELDDVLSKRLFLASS